MKSAMTVILLSNMLYSMEQTNLIICVSDHPTQEEPAINNRPDLEIQGWIVHEMQERDRTFAESIATLKYRIDELESRTPTINARTKAALITTALVSVCSAVSAIVTFFAERQAQGSD